MRVLQRIKDVERPIILWDLDKSFVESEVKWYQGQIEITAEDVQGFEYRVSSLSCSSSNLRKGVFNFFRLKCKL